MKFILVFKNIKLSLLEQTKHVEFDCLHLLVTLRENVGLHFVNLHGFLKSDRLFSSPQVVQVFLLVFSPTSFLLKLGTELIRFGLFLFVFVIFFLDDLTNW